MKKLLTILFCLQITNVFASSWYNQQANKSLNYLLDNISRADTPKGFVVASPSKEEPNYYYHWVRDAALVMAALDHEMNDTKEKDAYFNDYINLVSYHQGIFALTDLGEPKFNPNGTSFQGPWGRPQNDGPALRSIALIKYALGLIKKGKTDYVKNVLYRAEIPAMTVIKRDLEYVSHHWRDYDFDLWEEVYGHHFYTRMAQRSALELGAKLARILNDNGAASWYELQAKIISQELNKHWSNEKGYILTTLNRKGGLDYKYSNLDTSVILAVNHSWIEGQSFSHTDSRVIKTYEKIKSTFKEVYPINHHSHLGVAVGRYPEDTYYGGHAWFLLTNAMAEYCFKLADKLGQSQSLMIDDLNRDFIKNRVSLNAHQKALTSAQIEKLVLTLNQEAYSYLERVKTHMDQSGRMDEQFSKFNGYMIGARDLTWSYASFLTIK